MPIYTRRYMVAQSLTAPVKLRVKLIMAAHKLF